MSHQSELIEGATSSPSDDEKLEGIGGWLVLLAISQVGGVVAFFMSLIATFSGLPPDTATVQPVAFFGAMIVDGAFLLLLIHTVYLFFTKSRRFPVTFIVSCVASISEPIALLGWIRSTKGAVLTSSIFDGETAKHYLVVIAANILWIAYALNSVRVHNTFTR